MRNLSAGLNWYLDQDIRVMLNYIHANVDDAVESGWLHIVETRVQFEF
jgi:phosphate-selective porin